MASREESKEKRKHPIDSKRRDDSKEDELSVHSRDIDELEINEEQYDTLK